jgi:hypothetical protein
VEGGFEESGDYLYHAIVHIVDRNIWVPGKTGEHLVRPSLFLTRRVLTPSEQGAAHCAFGGEHIQRDNYSILCWTN